MKAHARLVATATDGATVLRELRGEPPLLPRVTGTRGPSAVAEVHLVGGAAGPIGGDELFLDIDVGPGASLVLRTVAATVALPGPHGRPSSTTIRACVAAGGRLVVRPEPVVAAAGCDHRVLSTVELDAGAQLVWWEELICGRYGEACGDLTMELAVRRSGQPVYRQDLAIGGRAPHWAGPAVLDGNLAYGTVLIIDGQSRPAATVDGGCLMALAEPGAYVATAVAPTAHGLRHTLERLAGSANEVG